MKFFKLFITILFSSLLVIQFTQAAIIPGAEVTGAISVNNNNGVITSNVNNPNSISVLFRTPTTSSTGGGGGGGGAFVEPNPSVSHTYVGGLEANKTYHSVLYSDSIFILNISFMIDRTITSDVEVRISQVIDINREPVPAMSSNKVVLNYGAIFYSGILNSYFKESEIVFEVYKDVLEMNGASKNEVRLYRYYEGNWMELDTRLIEETDQRYVFRAYTPGFSYFAVVVPNRNIEQETNEQDSSDNSNNNNDNAITGDVTNNNNQGSIDEESGASKTTTDTTTKKRNNIFPLLLVILIGGMLGAYIYISQQQQKGKFSEDQSLITGMTEVKKEQTELFGAANIDENVFKSPQNQLHDYVEEELREGFSREEIVNELLKAGWEQSMIAKVIDEFKNSFLEKKNVHSPNEDFANLRSFVDRKLAKGYSKEIIKKNLLRVGWQEPIINSVIYDANKTTQTSEKNYSSDAEIKLDDFIRKAFARGHSKEQIIDKLLKVGWPKNTINKVMKKY